MDVGAATGGALSVGLVRGERVPARGTPHDEQLPRIGHAVHATRPGSGSMSESGIDVTDEEIVPTHELVVIAGSLAGERRLLTPGRHLIGRGSACDIELDDPEVSRRHLLVTIDAEGVRVEDEGSTNGTWVGGSRITGEMPVSADDKIEIGESTFLIRPEPGPTAVGELPPPEGAWSIPVGTDDRDHSVFVDLVEGHLLALGPYKSGRSSLLSALAMGARRLEHPPRLHLLAPRRSPLTELTEWDSVAVGTDEVLRGVARLGELLLDASPAIVFIDDADEMGDDDLDDFETVIRKSRDSLLRLVIAFESSEANRTFGGWLIEVRKQKHGMLLQPDPVVDGQLLGVELPGRPDHFRPGTGYLVKRGEVTFVRVADIQQ